MTLMKLLMLLPLVALANDDAAQVNPTANLVMMGGMVLVFYFMLWRPQSKRAKAHVQLVSSIKSGDEIILNSGIVGRVESVVNEYITLVVNNGTSMLVRRTAVEQILPKGTVEGLK